MLATSISALVPASRISTRLLQNWREQLNVRSGLLRPLEHSASFADTEGTSHAAALLCRGDGV